MADPRPSAIGGMRLSTEPDRTEQVSIAVLHAAFDAGVTLVDTADAYCWNDTERGHNERLIARAIAEWNGDRSRIKVATKGGIRRADGRWEPDGRAKHLSGAARDSLVALGVERIHLYQLHTPDPRTPLATSVRALAALQREGVVERIGLCNVTVGQIEEARRIADIHSIQVELSVWQDANILSGVAKYCSQHGLTLLAHRPLGGRRARARTAADPVLNSVAVRHGVTPFEIALAWLLDLAPVIVPLPGVTRIDTARTAGRVRDIRLSDEDRRALDERFPAATLLREHAGRRSIAQPRQDAEVVLVMGMPGAGKTTVAQRYVADGYERLSRDDAGGSLRELLPALDRLLARGNTNVVLDNTYVSRKSRGAVLQAASARRVPVRCVWLSTTIEDAQVNAAWRLVTRYGHLPGDEEITVLQKEDVAAFFPTAQFRYQRAFEPPDVAEGFSRIEVVPFERVADPAHVTRALIVWCDDVLMRSRSGARTPSDADDLLVDENRADTLRRYHEEGWRVLGLSWQPEIGSGSRSVADVERVFARLNGRLGFAMDVAFCPHVAGAPRCWCRKPLPGLGVLLIDRHQLDASRCLYVGAGPQDPGFARKLGFSYRDAADFFRP